MNKKERERSNNIVNYLKKNNATKDKKWIYNICAWVIENKHQERKKIAAHINTIIKYHKGYFEKYKREKDNDYWKKYYKEYYKKHSKEIISTTIKNQKRMSATYQLYARNKLSEHSTEKISKMLNKLEKVN